MKLRWISTTFFAAAFWAACSNGNTSPQQPDDDTADLTSTSTDSSSSITPQSSSSSKGSSSTEQGQSEPAKESSSSTTSSSSEESSSSTVSSSSEESSSSTVSSSSEESSSSHDFWDWDKPKDSYFNLDIEYGTITDERDGEKYKTVKINNLTWLAENLNYADSAKTPSLKGKSWCYDDVASHCDVLGRLYTWAAAIDSAALASDKNNPQICGFKKSCSLPSRVRGICPSGWHLPTVREFENLGLGLETDLILKSTTGWEVYENNGTNTSGFTALPSGIRKTNLKKEASFLALGSAANYWTIDNSGTETYSMHFLESPYDQYFVSNDRTSAISIRCVMDYDTIQGWSWDVPKEERLNPEVVYDSIIDERDNKVYKTVKIGDQTWMAENLNYADSISTPSLIGHSLCYDNDSAKCNVTGRLYFWEAAIDSVALATDETNPQECGRQREFTCTLPTRVQGICPKGWHLPDSTEISTLMAYAGERSQGGKMLKSMSGWNASGPSFDQTDENGVDAYGFSALPSGYFNRKSNYAGVLTAFWGFVAGGCCEVIMHLGPSDWVSMERAYSQSTNPIRCIKD